MKDVQKAARLDADYFKPGDLKTLHVVRDHGGSPLGSICSIMTGKTPLEYGEAGSCAVVRSGDLVSPLIYPGCGRSFLHATPDKGTVYLKSGDVLISSIGMGSIGKISLVIEPTGFSTVSEVTILRDSVIPPEFLWAYLSTKEGQSQIEREVTGATGQQHLLKSKVQGILIPSPLRGVEQRISQAIAGSVRKAKAGYTLYADAQAMLATGLGLGRLDLAPHLFYERSYKDVTDAGRLDAEHYQPKYTNLLNHLRATRQAGRLGGLLSESPTRGLQPIYDRDGNILVINSQHVGEQSIDLDGNDKTTAAYAARSAGKGRVRHYDVLLNSTGYVTIGRCQPMLENIDAVVDSHVTILRPMRELDPVYLSVFLNTMPGLLQTERGWTGSSGQIELRLETIQDFLIWVAPKSLQQGIRRKVEAAHAARQEAQHLLEKAYNSVERALLGG